MRVQSRPGHLLVANVAAHHSFDAGVDVGLVVGQLTARVSAEAAVGLVTLEDWVRGVTPLVDLQRTRIVKLLTAGGAHVRERLGVAPLVFFEVGVAAEHLTALVALPLLLLCGLLVGYALVSPEADLAQERSWALVAFKARLVSVGLVMPDALRSWKYGVALIACVLLQPGSTRE